MENEKKQIYPQCGRTNYNAGIYADIAMRNYIRAKRQFECLDFGTTGLSEYLAFDLFFEYSVSTIIFSTMCIESFLNDYAAACLGDDEFYGYFDKLSIEGKFALIGKFLLKTDIDKSVSYYSRLKKLVRDRNEYTHSKSLEVRLSDLAGLVSELTLEDLEAMRTEVKPYRELLDSAKNSLCAIRDIAYFFDANDSGIIATKRLFGIDIVVVDDARNDVRKEVWKELQIKLKDGAGG